MPQTIPGSTPTVRWNYGDWSLTHAVRQTGRLPLTACGLLFHSSWTVRCDNIQPIDCSECLKTFSSPPCAQKENHG